MSKEEAPSMGRRKRTVEGNGDTPRIPARTHGGLELEPVEVKLPHLEIPEQGPGEEPSLYDLALADLQRRGLTLELRPIERPEDPPPDLLSLGTGLFDIFNRTERYWEFLCSALGEIESRMEDVKRRLVKIKARLEKRGVEGADMELDGEYSKWQDAWTFLTVQRKQVETLQKTYSNRLRAMSRSVEGLKAELHLGGRGANLGRKAGYGGLGGDL